MPGGENGPATLNGAAFTYPEKTLAELRQRLMIRLGFSAMAANPPPGLAQLIDDFLTDANDQLFERYPVIRNNRWWNITVNNAGGRFYDVPYTGAYIGRQIDISFNASNEINRASGDFEDDGFAAGQEIRVEGSASNDAIHTISSLTGAQIITSGTPAIVNEAAGPKIVVSSVDFRRMDFKAVREAWINDGSTWSEMCRGIDPGLFNQTNTSIPLNYELREFVEIWPTPDKEYQLYFLCDAAVAAFEHDSDYPSVDSTCIFLMALANAKAHYGQPDANSYFRQLEVRIGKFVAGTHAGRRYIPTGGKEPKRPLPYPQTTFPRP